MVRDGIRVQREETIDFNVDEGTTGGNIGLTSSNEIIENLVLVNTKLSDLI